MTRTSLSILALLFAAAPLAHAQIPGGSFTRSTVTTGGLSSVTIGGDGLGLIAYGGGPPSGLWSAHCSNPACSSATVALLDEVLYVSPSIVTGVDGLGLISYLSPDGVKVAHCSNPSCTTATISVVDPAGSQTAVAIGADGLGLISIVDRFNGDLKVAHCSNASCSISTISTIDTNGASVNSRHSITVGADGFGLIAYWGASRLKVARCSDAVCTTATISALAGGSWSPSITIGADGLPLVSFDDGTNGMLRVAHCSNPDCSNATIATVPDTAGSYTAVRIGADGRGLIAYIRSDGSGGYYEARVAHCNDIACSGVTTDIIGHATNEALSIAFGADGLPLITFLEFGNLRTAHQAPRGDFNSDGRQDLLWRRDASGDNLVWLMNGVDLVSASFTNPATLADPGWKIAGTNDFNGDAQSDLLWRHADSGENVVWFMNGVNLVSGTFTTPSVLADVRWQMAGTGDFDRDGRPDILWRHGVSGQNVLWYMNGTVLATGTFLTPSAVPDAGWTVGGTGDFNRDGKTDILWHHQGSGQVVVWYMDGSVLTSGTFTDPPALPDVAWKVAAVGDYNADARPDIVWRHQASGQTVVWLMDGPTLASGTFTNPSTVPDTNWRLVGPR